MYLIIYRIQNKIWVVCWCLGGTRFENGVRVVILFEAVGKVWILFLLQYII